MYSSSIVTSGWIVSELNSSSLVQSLGVLIPTNFIPVCESIFNPTDFCPMRKDWKIKVRRPCLLHELLSFPVDVVAIQETRFVCKVDAHVLSNDFVVYSAYKSRSARELSLLVKHSLDMRVDLVYIGARWVGLVDRGQYYCEKWFISGHCSLCTQWSEGALFVLLSVGAVPGGFSIPSFNVGAGLPSWTPSSGWWASGR